MGAELLVQTLPEIAAGRVTPQIQDESLVTYAAKIDKQETALDWTHPAEQLSRQVRAFYPRWGLPRYWQASRSGSCKQMF